MDGRRGLVHDLDALSWMLAASGLPLIALGAFVAAVGRRERRQVAFAVYAISLGLAVLLLNLGDVHQVPDLLDTLAGLFFLVAAPSALALALEIPMPTGGLRGRLVAALLAAAPGIAWGVAHLVEATVEGWWGEPGSILVVLDVARRLFYGAIWATLAIWALRLRETTPADRRGLLAASFGMLLYPAFSAGDGLTAWTPSAPWYDTVQNFEGVVALAFVSALWVRAAVRERDGKVVAVAWTALATALAAEAWSAWWPGVDWGYAIARILGAAVLAVALLRHELLGLDVRLRWAISKSTLGAIFVAAFFVVSAIAQRFFESSLGPYLGIAAAGALIFAIAPLQRLADRIANAAVPLATHAIAAPSAPDAAERERAERVFVRAVRAAVEDGRITRAEEEHLAHIAHELGISHLDALRLRREVEDAMPGRA